MKIISNLIFANNDNEMVKSGQTELIIFQESVSYLRMYK